MKSLTLTLGVLFAVSAFADDTSHFVGAINVTNRRPIPATPTVSAIKAFADEGNYYLSVHLEEGMAVSFSASYGVGREAAQAKGVLVKRDGKFFFKMLANPSRNLLLPPGLAFNSPDNVSLWDIGAYMELISRVAFSQSAATAGSEMESYDQPKAYLVDFVGGTAGSTVKYTDAMEVGFSKSFETGADANFQAYYAKGIGPVALEFRETSEPQGTFKFYLGK